MTPGCIPIPIPSWNESVVSGHRFTDKEVLTMISSFKSLQELKKQLGEPTLDFGPNRVFVYQWTAKKGTILWVGYRILPDHWLSTHQLFIAFDPNGGLLKAGVSESNNLLPHFESVSEQVHDWLSQNSLSSQIFSPRPGQINSHGSLIFVYRPSSSPCPFPHFDSNHYKPSIKVDGHVVGDVGKGKYLSFEINSGQHEITIALPDYRYLRIDSKFIPANVKIIVEAGIPQYIETYLCDGESGDGKVKMQAGIRDEATALKALENLEPAW